MSMFIRVRWFFMGVLASVGALAYLAAQVKAARQRLTPENLAKTGANSLAGALESAAVAITPSRRED